MSDCKHCPHSEQKHKGIDTKRVAELRAQGVSAGTCKASVRGPVIQDHLDGRVSVMVWAYRVDAGEMADVIGEGDSSGIGGYVLTNNVVISDGQACRCPGFEPSK